MNHLKENMSGMDRAVCGATKNVFTIVAVNEVDCPICKEFYENYKYCRVCGKELSKDLILQSFRNLYKEVCSMECHHKEIKKQFACCEKAEFLPCVCTWSFRCAEHGDTHIGTHD